MTEHLNARSGLRTVFFAEILFLLGSCMNFVAPNVDLDIDPSAPELGLTAWLFSVLSITAFVAMILEVIGLAKAGRDAQGYKKALLYSIISLATGLVVAVLNMLIPSISTLLGIISVILSNLFQIIAAYYLMTTSLKFLAENGENDTVTLGSKLWIVYILGSLLLMLCSVLSNLNGMPSTVLAYVCGVLGLARSAALVIFLAKAFPRV